MILDGPEIEPYDFTVGFERALVALLCSRPRFYGLVGRELDADSMVTPAGVLAVQTCQEIAKATGMGPGSPLTVVQQLRRGMEDGKVTKESMNAVDDMIAEAEDDGLPPEADVLAQIVPTLRRRIHMVAIRMALKNYSTQAGMERVQAMLERAASLGQNDAAPGIKVGDGSFGVIAELRHLERLPFGIDEVDNELDGGVPRGTVSMFIGGAGDGKCHAKGQGILMYDGTIKRVEDVKVGDRLMGPDSRPKRVMRTNTGRGAMYNVCPVTGDTWTVNAHHILTLAGTDRYEGKVVDVSVKEWLEWSKRRKRHFKLYQPPAVSFKPGADLPIDPYFLGVLLGDGSLYDDIRVTTTDPEIVAEIARQAAHYGLRVNPYRNKKAPSYAISDTPGKRNPIASELMKLGLRGKRCGTKFIPHDYKVADRWFRLCLLAGLMDTDGSANKTAYDYISKSKALANDVAFVARSLGMAAHVRPCRKGCQTGAVGTYYRVGISGDGVADIPCRVPRKRLPRRLQRKDARRRGFIVEATGKSADYYGFTLNGDGRYLLDDFTVTHNSMALSHVAAHACRGGMFFVYATLELPEAHVLARVKSNHTRVPINAILDGSGDAQAALLASPPAGPCYVKEFTPQLTTVADIQAWVEEVERIEQRPVDGVVIDYADKLTAATKEKNTGAYKIMELVYESFRIWMHSTRKWGFTASQSTRGDKRSKRPKDLEDVADSINKVRVVDLVLTLNIDDEEMMTFHVAKNRYGKSRQTIGPLPTDFACGAIVAGSQDNSPTEMLARPVEAAFNLDDW